MGTVAEGRDTYCLDTYVPGRLVSGAELVAQRSYRRLSTPKGSLRGGEDEADFGIDLAGYIGSTNPRDVDSALPVRVQNELMKDPAIVSVDVTAARTEDAGHVSWTLTIDLVTTSGDVQLILAVSSVTVALLGVS